MRTYVLLWLLIVNAKLLWNFSEQKRDFFLFNEFLYEPTETFCCYFWNHFLSSLRFDIWKMHRNFNLCKKEFSKISSQERHKIFDQNNIQLPVHKLLSHLLRHMNEKYFPKEFSQIMITTTIFASCMCY
jgi:hypothetical protein